MRFPDPAEPEAFIPAWKFIWPVFGATNQLLAAMALVVVFIWLAKTGRRTLYVLLPLLFMLVTTTIMLIQLVRQNLFGDNTQPLIGMICAALLVLAVLMVADTFRCWRKVAHRRRASSDVKL